MNSDLPQTPLIKALDKVYDWLLEHKPDVALSLQPGLTRQEIDELTKDLPCRLPEEIYQLYQWRNGCEHKCFIEDKEFYSLQKSISISHSHYKYYENRQFRVYKHNWLTIFGTFHDFYYFYSAILGQKEIAPIRNFDPDDQNYSFRHISLTKMMQTVIIGYAADTIDVSYGFDMSNSDFSNQDLGQAFLTRANLENANLSNIKVLKDSSFKEANLKNANLENACLRNSDFRNADLSGANLKNADLRGAYFHYTILENANLTNTNFKNSAIDKYDLEKAILCNTIMPDGSIVSN